VTLPIQAELDDAVARARKIAEGAPADYIPELARVDLEATSAAVHTVQGELFSAGDAARHVFTLQSTAKLVLLIGLLEELGPDEVFRVVGTEPSGTSFASLARLETHGPGPANPLVNAGAIALAGQLPGSPSDRLAWVGRWAERLYGGPISVDQKVLASERVTSDRNQAIAHLLRHNGVIEADVDETLEVYYSLCSLSAGVREAAHLPALLASGGVSPKTSERVLRPETVTAVVSLMATCGMYDESGIHLVATGLPAKSGVSGVIVAVAPGRAGIAVSSPRVNAKGGSVRGHAMLEHLSQALGWHFALPLV
jgi:glutaminase